MRRSVHRNRDITCDSCPQLHFSPGGPRRQTTETSHNSCQRLLKRASTNNFLRYYIAYHRYKVPRSNAKARSAVGMDMTRMPRIVDAPFRILSRRATGNVESAVVIRDQISAAGDDDESNPSFLPLLISRPAGMEEKQVPSRRRRRDAALRSGIAR